MPPLLRRAFASCVAAFFFCQVVGIIAPLPTQARVDPLTIIKRQIHKPNMLVLLDTSGSLTGVPGGSFDNSDEVGVDCDDGQSCRGGVSPGVCNGSGKACTTDNHCRSTTCATGSAACTTDADCPPIAGRCATGETCFADADCPARATGRCQYNTSDSCSATDRCSVRMRCRYGSSSTSCSSDASCPTGTCAGSSTTCRASADCPYAASGGSCAHGTTPAGGCARTSDCPARAKVCSDNPNQSCTTVNDCGGRCDRSNDPCRSNDDCRERRNDYCDFAGKTCAAPANSCLLPRLSCNVNPAQADNVCLDTNPCVPDANVCSGASALNVCRPGTVGDLCNAPASAGGMRMCRLGQTICTRDSNCTIAGDSCGPATSRTVIAKRAIRNVVNANANVVNLGLMTFYQDRYFPYYRVDAPTTVTRTVMLHNGTLQSNKCYSKKTGLDPICRINGVEYRLRATNNTRYLVTQAPRQTKYVDQSYCGWFCSVPGEGTGVFKYAFYEHTEVTGGASTLLSPPPDSYQGRSFTSAGVTYRYYDPRPDYYNGGAPPPIDWADCGSSCSARCGARWDTKLAPFMSSDDSQASLDAMLKAFNQALEPASQGGLISIGGTPSGCALENSGSPDRNHSAYHYMQAVKAADTLPCRQNFVLFITDGEANGPGDSGCTSGACAAADPVAAGCTCRAVNAAYRMRTNLGVRTFVVGFSVDAAAGNGRIVNDNIARAGGTDVSEDGRAPYAFAAASERQLNEAVQGAIYQAVQGSYSTSPPTASQGRQQGSALSSGTLVIDARVDFPSWKGHLLAYDVSTPSPTLLWDASTVLSSGDWRQRRVYTSDAQNRLVRFDVDPGTGALRNRDQLHALGLGATAEEAEQIARFTLGDPALRNPALLGAMINSTPVEVGPPTESSLPGAHEFHEAHKDRPGLIYVGANDGMLHAFVTRPSSVGGVSYAAGSEAFAYMPPSMLGHAARLYAQGGQLADPAQHLYGLASSAKVKNVCFSGCTSRSAQWKTVLMMTEGWGGNGAFALDITSPLGGSSPFSVLWTTGSQASASTYRASLGETVSIPAFTFIRSENLDDHRLLMASGYPVSGDAGQGRQLLSIKAATGAILASASINPGGSCPQEYGLLTDVATSRQQVPSDSGAIEGRKELIAGYIGDTWGNLWRYEKNGQRQRAAALGCEHPLHFSPTVVQLDQDDPHNPHAGDIYLVLLTNSTYDRSTESYPGSRMVIMKERFVDGRPVPDLTFGSNGQVTLTTASNAQMCGVTDATGRTCLQSLGAAARPLSSAMAIPKSDGAGFTLISTWYEPATAGCGKGSTYLLMHEVNGAVVTMKQALKIADEPVVSTVVAAGKLMITGSQGPMSIGGSITTNIASARAPGSSAGDLFRMSSWSEVD